MTKCRCCRILSCRSSAEDFAQDQQDAGRRDCHRRQRHVHGRAHSSPLQAQPLATGVRGHHRRLPGPGFAGPTPGGRQRLHSYSPRDHQGTRTRSTRLAACPRTGTRTTCFAGTTDSRIARRFAWSTANRMRRPPSSSGSSKQGARWARLAVNGHDAWTSASYNHPAGNKQAGSMQDYEKLGAFYLGRRFDTDKGATSDEIILYDSKDLTTHAVIIGMTGSGKTGPGHRPDRGSSPGSHPGHRHRPEGRSRQSAADLSQAERRRSGALGRPPGGGREGSDARRVRRGHRETLARRLANPGGKAPRASKPCATRWTWPSTRRAAQPASRCRCCASLRAPPPELLEDLDLYRDRLQGTVTSLLTLLDIDADPVSSPAHILLTSILDREWQAGTLTGSRRPDRGRAEPGHRAHRRDGTRQLFPAEGHGSRWPCSSTTCWPRRASTPGWTANP